MTERRRAERRRAEIDWKFYKKVFWLALPIALQSLITIGVNMLDTIMVGNLGEMSLSAVSLANQFIGVYQLFEQNGKKPGKQFCVCKRTSCRWAQ